MAANESAPSPFEHAVGVALGYFDPIACHITGGELREATQRLRDALLALPVEQRMEAMGMTFYGEVGWDDEAEADTITPAIEVTPGAVLYVEAEMRWTDD